MKTLWKQPINILIALVWCDDFLLQYVRLVAERLPFVSTVSGYIIPIMYATSILLAIHSFHLYRSDIVFLVCVLMMYFISPVLFPDTTRYWEQQWVDYLTIVLPFYILGVAIVPNVDIKRTTELLYKLSVMTICFKLFYFLMRGPLGTVETIAEGDMAQAYQLLPHICLVAYCTIKKATIFRVSLLGISCFYLVFLGNRGSVLILAISSVMLYVCVSNYKYRLRLSCIAALLVIAFLFSPLFEVTMDALQEISTELGMSTRIFDLVNEGDLTNSTGRSNKFVVLFDALNKQPVTGYGIYGDRVFLNFYCHNLILELLIDYGYLAGSLLLICVVVLLVRTVMLSSSTEYFALLVCLLGNGFWKLFFSGSYLLENTFYLLLGYCVALIRHRRYLLTQ